MIFRDLESSRSGPRAYGIFSAIFGIAWFAGNSLFRY
jgi:hypothetical protein